MTPSPIPPVSKKRRPYRVPMGLPKGRDNWRTSSVVSILVHVAIIALLLTPFAIMHDIFPFEQGAGGPGPAGGGGGGNRGTGARTVERVTFVRVAPLMPTPAPPKVEPVVVPPPPVLPPMPTPEPPVAKDTMPTMPAGSGGGAGTDMTSGSGTGSGGGVGTGTGTGRGSGTGPGTGGGIQADFPPTPTEMFIPPMPVPASAKGMSVLVEFDVDVSGKVLGVNHTDTRDRGYNRRLKDVLRGYRFRPGHRPDGTPIRMKFQMTVELP